MSEDSTRRTGSTDPATSTERRRRPAAVTVVVAVLGVLGFLFAVQLLGASVRDLAPGLGPVLRQTLDPDVAALGASWLVAYVVLNGSVVAAVAISLFDVGLVSGHELFLLVVGSRLGAAGMVVLVGALDYLQRRDRPLRESVGLGVFTFLVTQTIYVPVAVLGYFSVPLTLDSVAVPDWLLRSVAGSTGLLTAGVEWIVALLGAVAGVVLAVVVFLASLQAFDRLFTGMDTDHLRDRYLRVLGQPWKSFAIGLLVTVVTTSVSFSIGVAVPLYNRGHLGRDEMTPYVLGASLGTLSDTMLVAVLLGSAEAVLVVLHVFVVGAVLTAIALARFDAYLAMVDAIQDRIVADGRSVALFFVLLVAVPLALVALAVLN